MKFFHLRKKIILSIAFALVAIFLLSVWPEISNQEEEEIEESYIIQRQETASSNQEDKDDQDTKKWNVYSTPPILATTNKGDIYFIKNKELWLKTQEAERQVTFDGQEDYAKSFVRLSPNQKYLAYFQDLSPKENMSKQDYYWQYYTSLRLLDLNSKKISEAYQGSFKVGSYEWLSDREIAVWVGCGTECSYLELVDIWTKNKTQLMYGVGYTWSPNKKYVLAYHYAIQSGISVGDRFGNTLFTVRREYPKDNERFSTHKAIWSPDSAKLVLIINKNGQAELELLVFDVVNKFSQSFQKDLGGNEFSELGWKDNNTVFYEVNGRILELTVLPQ